MERIGRHQLLWFFIFLVAVWLLMLSVQVNLVRKANSNQKELFRVKLIEVLDNALDPLDTLDYHAIDSLIGRGFQDHDIPYSYNIGIYSDDEDRFLFTTEHADTIALMENGLQYQLIYLMDDESYYYTVYIHFPSLMKTFRRNTFFSYLIVIVTLILLLICFIQFFTILLKQRKINSFRTKMGHFVVHELKTPLTTINLTAQLLRDKSVTTDEANRDSCLDMIVDETKTLELLAEDVLTIFSLEEIPKIDKSGVALHNLLETVCKIHKPRLDECHAEVNLDFQAECDTVLGIQTHLFNAFSNLIDNAIKYRQGDLRLDIVTQNQGNNIVVKVTDNGIGIRKENLPLIFEPFVRFNAEDAYYVKGFGLGLDYVKHIIDYHKGSVAVESELNKGTTFIVTLPLKI